MYQESFNFIQEGWRCPQCKSILAPHISFCPYCNVDRSTTIQTDKTTVIPFDDRGWWDDYQRRTTGDAKALEQTWKQFTTNKVDIEITPSGAILYHGPAMECYL